MISTFLCKKGKEFRENVSRAEMLSALADKNALLWVDLEDPSEFESDTLVEIFNFHPLAIEDCLSDHSEPKVDDYDDYLFLVLHAVKMIRNEEIGQDELTTNELEIFFGKNYVVTFHKTPVKTVQQVREAVRKKGEAMMGSGADRLFHAILDHLVDNYQPLLNLYDAKIDRLEEEIFNNPPADYLQTVMQVKQDVYHMRRMIAPQRETIHFLTKNPYPFIDESNLMYFKDVYDHLQRLHAITDSFHDNLSSILQAYFSYSSHKLNEIVKHMTVMATLTMPAILVASIYGMNFSRMPGLDWGHSFPVALGVMAAISAVMLIWMKWKKWI